MGLYVIQVSKMQKNYKSLLTFHSSNLNQTNAVPVNDPIELAVDFEPDMVGCDRYEQFVELVS